MTSYKGQLYTNSKRGSKLVNFDPLLKLVYSLLLIFKCVGVAKTPPWLDVLQNIA